MRMRAIAGVIVGGTAGCLATGMVVTILAGDAFGNFFMMWNKYIVSIAIAIPLPFFFRVLGTGPATIVSIVWCGTVAALLTQFIFISPASWVAVRIFNTVFAVITVVVYRLVTGSSWKTPV